MPPKKTGRYDNLQEDAVVNHADPNIILILPIFKSSPTLVTTVTSAAAWIGWQASGACGYKRLLLS